MVDVKTQNQENFEPTISRIYIQPSCSTDDNAGLMALCMKHIAVLHEPNKAKTDITVMAFLE